MLNRNLKIEEIYARIETYNGVFKPDSGSFALARSALNYKGRFLDVGTGTGFVSVVLSLNGLEGDACDISSSALRCAKKNFEVFGITAKPFYSNIFSQVTSKYDMILFNPSTSAVESERARKIKNFFKRNFPVSVLFPVVNIFWSQNSGKRREFLSGFIVQSKKHLNEKGIVLINILKRDENSFVNRCGSARIREIAVADFSKIFEVKFS